MTASFTSIASLYALRERVYYENISVNCERTMVVGTQCGGGTGCLNVSVMKCYRWQSGPAVYKLIRWASVSADSSVLRCPPADKSSHPEKESTLTGQTLKLKVVCFVFTEQERKLRANDREYNLSFKYAVRTHSFIHLVQ